ncbi:MAG: YbaB/EbfC family nucleoid-associated protein [Candidatus Omnitrophota bacterium]
MKELKNFMAMQAKMKQVKERLEDTVFSIDGPGGIVRIVMNGVQEVKEVTVSTPIRESQKESLEKDIKEAYNKAVAYSRQLAAQEMKDITGFNVP